MIKKIRLRALVDRGCLCQHNPQVGVEVGGGGRELGEEDCCKVVLYTQRRKTQKSNNASLRFGWATALVRGEARKWFFSRLTFLPPPTYLPTLLLRLLQLESGQPHLIMMTIMTIWWQFGAKLKCIEFPAYHHWNSILRGVCVVYFQGNMTWPRGGDVSREKGKIRRITLRKHRCCKLSFMGVLDTLSGLTEKWSEEWIWAAT